MNLNDGYAVYPAYPERAWLRVQECSVYLLYLPEQSSLLNHYR